jgi:hypothetical protein
MYPDVKGRDGVPEVTVEDIFPLGFNFMTMHYLLKAAMDGMLEHGKKNYTQQGVLYTCDKEDAHRYPRRQRHAALRSAGLHGTGRTVHAQTKGLYHRRQRGGGFPAGLREDPIDDRLT